MPRGGGYGIAGAQQLPELLMDSAGRLAGERLTVSEEPWRAGCADLRDVLREAGAPPPAGPRAETGWRIIRKGMRRAIPVRITVAAVSPLRDLSAFHRRAKRVVETAAQFIVAVDRSCGGGALPRWWWTGAREWREVIEGGGEVGRVTGFTPASLDIAVYLWPQRKRAPEEPGVPIGVSNANTGVTILHGNGVAKVMVYRSEEAAKTLAHEILHSYRVGEWANTHEGAIGAARRWGDSINLREWGTPEPLPAESIVDAFAVRLTWAMYGRRDGVTWEECEAAARTAAARAAAALAVAGGRQKTPVVEYHPVKNALVGRAEDLLRAHAAGGLQRPDTREAVARAMACFPLPSAARVTRLSLRSTPVKLAPL